MNFALELLLKRQEQINLRLSLSTIIYLKHLCKETGKTRSNIIEDLVRESNPRAWDNFWEKMENNEELLKIEFAALKGTGKNAERMTRKNIGLEDSKSIWE